MKEVDIQRKLLKCSMYVKCGTCCGSGKVFHKSSFYDNNNVEPTETYYYEECPECHGTGKIRKSQPESHKFKKTLL